jgi:mycoredoxin
MPPVSSVPSAYGRRSAPTTAPVVVYGRRWCALSQMVRRHLDRMAIPYDYVDLDARPELESRLSWLTGGRVHSPVVYVAGEILVQPGIGEIDWALSRSGVR